MHHIEQVTHILSSRFALDLLVAGLFTGNNVDLVYGMDSLLKTFPSRDQLNYQEQEVCTRSLSHPPSFAHCHMYFPISLTLRPAHSKTRLSPAEERRTGHSVSHNCRDPSRAGTLQAAP